MLHCHGNRFEANDGGRALTDQPILLFLHGVGDGPPEVAWKDALDQSLRDAGFPDLESVQVIAPRYGHALRGTDDVEEMPERTLKPLSKEAAKQNRTDFERRLAGIERRIGSHDAEHFINKGIGDLSRPAMDRVADAAVGLAPFEQAAKYLASEQIRAHVLNRILTKIPDSGSIVIVAHSLGSVIAADLLLRLPVDVNVAAMVTIGSPLANEKFDLKGLRGALTDPPAKLTWWVNFRNAWDPVATRRGLSSVFPWLLDHHINTGPESNPMRPHYAAVYLGHVTVADTIGYALFGSKSKEVALGNSGNDVPLDDVEKKALVGLRHSHLTKNHLTGDTRRRFLAALRSVQAQTIADLRSRSILLNQPFPQLLARLEFDFADESSLLPEPAALLAGTAKEEAIGLLTAMAASNAIAPFEIEVPKDVEGLVLQEISAEMGLMKKFGSDVLDASKKAQKVVGDGQNLPWVKVGVLAVGMTALVVGTGGLALAVAPGVAGAAAVTSALASFGPGGMIGGLITAGTLVGGGGLLVGSGGRNLAAGLSGAETTAEQFEAAVSLQLSAVILRQLQGLEADPRAWSLFTDLETEVNRLHEQLDEISDKKAATVRNQARKRDVVKRALAYMTENKLDPPTSSALELYVEPQPKRGIRFGK